jgi:hypothetical protein
MTRSTPGPPVVAVLIATCGRPGLLAQRSLTSVQRQTCRPEFLVVVDDSDPTGCNAPYLLQEFCPPCHLQLHSSRRFALNGSPASYFCSHCHKELAKLNDSHRTIVHDALMEMERRERAEQLRFDRLVRDKRAAGMSLSPARSEALQQIQRDRTQIGPEVTISGA